jgi:hypothetical protein
MRFLIIVGAMVLLCGCSRSGTLSIEREDLAVFEIGVFEDELDLFNLEGRGILKKTELTMRDGQFFIVNGVSGKVVRYNSYGDLLFMIYNEETNPRLLNLKQKTEGAAETRWAHAWALQEPSYIAVDSQKKIFVVDKLPPERHSLDTTEKAILDSIVLCFDETGRFIEYLGQEGPGSTPFARVEGLWTSQDDSIVVASRFSKGIRVYCFDSSGSHRTTLQFDNERLPIPEEKQGVIMTVESITVAPDMPLLYLKINYYRRIIDTAVNASAGVEVDSSWLWVVDMESGEYIRHIEIPFYESLITENNKKTSEQLVYSLFGAANGEKLFFYVPVEEGYAIMILQADETLKQRRGTIKVNPDELEYITFNVSADGVLSALLANNFNVRLVWWRTDKLAREMGS